MVVSILLLPGRIVESGKERCDDFTLSSLLLGLLLVGHSKQPIKFLSRIPFPKELGCSSLLCRGVVVAISNQVQEFRTYHNVIIVLVRLLHETTTTSVVDVNFEEGLVTSVDDLFEVS